MLDTCGTETGEDIDVSSLGLAGDSHVHSKLRYTVVRTPGGKLLRGHRMLFTWEAHHLAQQPVHSGDVIGLSTDVL